MEKRCRAAGHVTERAAFGAKHVAGAPSPITRDRSPAPKNLKRKKRHREFRRNAFASCATAGRRCAPRERREGSQQPGVRTPRAPRSFVWEGRRETTHGRRTGLTGKTSSHESEHRPTVAGNRIESVRRRRPRTASTSSSRERNLGSKATVKPPTARNGWGCGCFGTEYFLIYY